MAPTDEHFVATVCSPGLSCLTRVNIYNKSTLPTQRFRYITANRLYQSIAFITLQLIAILIININMPGITKQHDDFETLVQALSDKLGPSSGINSDDVDEHEIQQLMKDYTSDESDWSKYSFSSTNMPYTRNLVDQGNGKSNLVPILQNYLMAMLTTKLILVWSPGHGSPIHE